MGDYLRSLAVRTLSPPAVRPRARSLFEPVKSPFMGMQETSFPETEQRIQLRETPTPRMVTSRERIAEPKGDRDGVRAETHVSPAPQRTTAPPEHEETPASSAYRRADSGRKEASPLTVSESLPTLTTIRTETPNRHAEKDPKIVEQAIERIDRVEKHTTVHSHETVGLAAKAENQKPIDAPAPRAAMPFRESVIPVHSSAPPTLPVTGFNTVAPEIHVSIGRVIVNAGAASAPRPQAPVAAPAIRLTLDQYLRQRGGRR